MSNEAEPEFSGVRALQVAVERERIEKLRKVRALNGLLESRTRLFGPTLFSDPAWDIMLRLFAANLERSSLPTAQLVSSIDSVPTSTILRFLGALEESGQLFRAQHDGQEVLDLTVEALAAMHALFETMPGASFL